MTEERIVQSVLMSAALVLGVVGCPPVPSDESDGGVGGSGSGTGGSATGGTTPVPVCATVASLPTMGTTCSTAGESQCDTSGNRCVCERGIWYCDTICAATYPTEPAPDSACERGAACTYPSGAGCQCVNLRWMCTGTSSCPTAANMPMSGVACNGLAGVWCDYPDPVPARHLICGCMSSVNVDAGSTWTCMQSSACPEAEPAYDPTATCATAGVGLCSYGSTRCKCWMGSPWVCGFGSFFFAMGSPTCPDCE